MTIDALSEETQRIFASLAKPNRLIVECNFEKLGLRSKVSKNSLKKGANHESQLHKAKQAMTSYTADMQAQDRGCGP